MSFSKAQKHLADLNMGDRLIRHQVSTSTVEEAAAAIGCAPEQIAKSLTFKDKNGGAILIVAAGDAKIDNAKFKTEFNQKAKMLTPDEVLTYVGHKIGGVCPFGVPEELAVYLDISLRRFDTVYPAGGAPNATAVMTCDELMQAGGAKKWIDVCKGWQ